MSTIYGHEHAAWESYGLEDYGDFAEKVSEVNQRDIGDCTEGTWFYIPDEPVTSEQGMYRVIYHGTWGNYNSPGASHYTYAEVYNVEDEGDMDQFEKDKENWEALPEWANEPGGEDEDEPRYCAVCGDEIDDDDEDNVDDEGHPCHADCLIPD